MVSKVLIVSIILFLIILVIISIILIGSNFFEFDDIDLVTKKGATTWANHNFEIASSGNVVFTDDGFEVIDGGLATTTLTDINMNQKIKVKVTADITGKHISGDWSEITLYIKYANSKYGVALFGNRDRTCPLSARLRGECTTEGVKVRDEFSFTWFTLENDGINIIFEDSSGRMFTLDEDTDTEHDFPNKNVEWNLGINSHVKGEGYTTLAIKKIEILN